MMDVTLLKERASSLLGQILPDMVALLERLYFCPELGFKEYQACSWITEWLGRVGYRIEMPFCGLKTAFRASLRGFRGSSFPAIALLAEYDALPGMGHGCGHNFIAACTTGSAVVLASILPFLRGSVQVIGCPAEEGSVEGAGGKVIIIEERGFKGVDAALMVHPSNRTVIHCVTTGRVALKIEFFGEPGYASGGDSDGVNALEAAIMTFNEWKALRSEFEDAVRVHGVITKGGEVPNIIPEFSEIRAYVRARDAELLRRGEQRVRECAENAAKSIGATIRISHTARVYEGMKSNRVLEEVFERNLNHAGMKGEELSRRIGAGSTDMGNVSRVVPAIQPYVAICEPSISPHTREFARATTSARSRKALFASAYALVATVIDLMAFPHLLAQAKEEFLNS
ncbi:MAG TPA: M20 family metallopeptidase [Clostridia bacterium]|nr:M20 family metallopeptidase [Clostridia bacterium]